MDAQSKEIEQEKMIAEIEDGLYIVGATALEDQL